VARSQQSRASGSPAFASGLGRNVLVSPFGYTTWQYNLNQPDGKAFLLDAVVPVARTAT